MFPYGALIGALIAVSQQQQPAVSPAIDRALDNLDLDACKTACERDRDRTEHWLTRELVTVRLAMAVSLEGRHEEALQMLRPLRVDQYPRLEKARCFNVEMLTWMLMGRFDAARDIVETQSHVMNPWFLDGRVRRRTQLAQAAFACAQQDPEKARSVLEGMSRRRRPLLDKVLALVFLGDLERGVGRIDDAWRCLSEAAALAPRSFVPAYVRRKMSRSAAR